MRQSFCTPTEVNTNYQYLLRINKGSASVSGTSEGWKSSGESISVTAPSGYSWTGSPTTYSSSSATNSFTMPSQPVELTCSAPKLYVDVTNTLVNWNGGQIKYTDWNGSEHTETLSIKKYPVMAGSTVSFLLRNQEKRNKFHFANKDSFDGRTTNKYEAAYGQTVTLGTEKRRGFTIIMPSDHDVVVKLCNPDAGVGDTIDVYWLKGYGWDMSKVGQTNP